ncbi:hypothetical protein PoB_000861000 [Plakobranchus ocellatus]|uniref:Uncharacterized protein n=1 Tax=Plakobranchus ocellatus TaxID=259542 RepID=A0AAV3YHU9_9GAST|nr:hypothetical protein PoB_000861000 [Plakobranchus ocellatus]
MTLSAAKWRGCCHIPEEMVDQTFRPSISGGVGSTVACESALRSAGTLLSRVRAPLPAPWPDGGPENLRSPCCGLAIYTKTQPALHQLRAPCRSSNPRHKDLYRRRVGMSSTDPPTPHSSGESP